MQGDMMEDRSYYDGISEEIKKLTPEEIETEIKRIEEKENNRQNT